MAFETVQIVSTRNGLNPIQGFRDDLVAGDLVGMSLSDTTGVSSFRWEIVGRPEGSAAGGAGPEPVFLGVGATASFSVDSDLPLTPKDGTYVVQCTINGGSPTETRKRALLIRLNPGVLADGRVLRKLGGFEELDDTSDPLVRQGWANMMNRWLEAISAILLGGAGDTETYKFSGILNGAAGAVVRHLADAGGDVVNGHEVVPEQKYLFCQDRSIICLKVQSLLNTLATDTLVTFLRNGAPTAFQVTIPAGVTGPFSVLGIVDVFEDQTFDIRVENTAGGAGNELALSVTMVQSTARPPPLAEEIDLSLDDDEEKQTTPASVAEEILYEYVENFDDLTFPNIYASLAGIARVEAPGPATGTFRVRIGATNPGSTLGSTVRATATTTSTTDVKVGNTGAAFAKPTGLQIVQITGQTTDGLFPAHMRGMKFVPGRA